MHFTFEYPFFFLLLFLLPCFWRCRKIWLRFYFPHTHYFRLSVSSLSLRTFFEALIFSLLVTALASPVLFDKRAAHERNGRDLVLVLDASGSMAESGFDTENKSKRKFDVMLEIVENFLDHRYDDNVGLVVFGTFAYSASPVTYDLNALKMILSMSDVGIAGESTAIGEGIAQAVHSLSFGHAKEKIVVLLTDGRHNAGSVSPKSAVQNAITKGIKIYTIGIGKTGDYDASMLQRIATQSQGKMFEAANAASLSEVYDKIDELEPSPLRSDEQINTKPLFTFPLLFAMVLISMMIVQDGRREV